MRRGFNHRILTIAYKRKSFAAFIMSCFISISSTFRLTRAFRTLPWSSLSSFIKVPQTKQMVHFMTNDAYPSTKEETLTMDNIYREWTIQDDKLLYDNRHLSTVKLASLLGRGLHGVDARRKKLTNVDSTAYLRLFAGASAPSADDEEKSTKLTPVKEILRRIQWDPTLDSSQFSIIHYDRLYDTLCETNFDASNDSISGKERRFVFALPEHRIQAVKYRERVVWDREKRIDCVFGSMNGRGETIDRVIETYDEWKREGEEREERNRRRYSEILEEMTIILGEERVDQLKGLLSNLIEKNGEVIAARENVKSVIGLYYESTEDLDAAGNSGDGADACVSDDHESDEPSTVQIVDFLYLLSELVALLPNEQSRETTLVEVEAVVKRLSNSSDSSAAKAKSRDMASLPELRDEDLEEKFVRGSGQHTLPMCCSAGGQKINKTSNKVILLHIPTQLRVECQDTRSLQQNRKIARKRLQLKLDDLINGDFSRTNQKALKVVAKKSKNKARNKRRQLKKKSSDNFSEDSDATTDATEYY
eukprot:CCRYP_019982-RA/>CCRYP_019982-RA protein AED:0.30 eAED:0.30 QI:126/0.5/0.66/1/1/1/3/244/533